MTWGLAALPTPNIGERRGLPCPQRAAAGDVVLLILRAAHPADVRLGCLAHSEQRRAT